MTLIFRLIIRRDIWIFHSKVFSSEQLVQLKILLLLYILFQLIKPLPNIKCMWIPLDDMRDWSIFSNSFFQYNSDNLLGLNSVPASSTHYWTWFIHYVAQSVLHKYSSLYKSVLYKYRLLYKSVLYKYSSLHKSVLNK